MFSSFKFDSMAEIHTDKEVVYSMTDTTLSSKAMTMNSTLFYNG